MVPLPPALLFSLEPKEGKMTFLGGFTRIFISINYRLWALKGASFLRFCPPEGRPYILS